MAHPGHIHCKSLPSPFNTTGRRGLGCTFTPPISDMLTHYITLGPNNSWPLMNYNTIMFRLAIWMQPHPAISHSSDGTAANGSYSGWPNSWPQILKTRLGSLAHTRSLCLSCFVNLFPLCTLPHLSFLSVNSFFINYWYNLLNLMLYIVPLPLCHRGLSTRHSKIGHYASELVQLPKFFLPFTNKKPLVLLKNILMCFTRYNAMNI